MLADRFSHRSSQLTLYGFVGEGDEQLMSARLLRSNLQYESTILLVNQFTERWLHRTFTCRQQLAYNTVTHPSWLETRQ